MKLIIAIIQPNKLEEVKAELVKSEIFRLTVSDVQGYGQQKGKTEVFRGNEISVNLLRKVRLEIAVNDDFVKPTVDAILKSAKSGPGKVGDGKIFIMPLEEVIRIRTGETGSKAI
jgi:nitrogen regulatory protein PII